MTTLAQPTVNTQDCLNALAEVLRFTALEDYPAWLALSVITPQAIADNTGRMYDWMHEIGLSAESDTREAMFVYASTVLGIDYDVFYDNWLDEKPVITH